MNEFVINPLSNRPIKKGSFLYYELLKKGVDFGGNHLENFKNDKIICEIGDKTAEEIDNIKREFNNTNDDYCCHRGRGFLSKYLVKKRKKLTYERYGLELAKISSKKIREYLENVDIEDDDIDVELQISKIIDRQSQILSRKYNNCSRFYLLKDNFSKSN
jgi:hypothetical protein